MADPTRFWNTHAGRYARQPVKDVESYERTLARCREHLSSADSVLELGCGTGTTALLLASSVKQIRATDFSPRMLEIAREKAAAQGVDNVRFELVEAGASPAGDGAYDAVLAFNLLHLLDDVPAAIRGVRVQLRPGGLFISKTICLGERTPLFAPLLGAMRLVGLAPKVQRLGIAELEQQIASEGFEIAEAESLPPSRPNRFIVARKR